jgi:uncharacterized YccA/Bax inhibitor family protein
MSKHQAINRFGVSSNPAFSKFQKINVSTIEGKMTLDGAVNKTAILLSLCFAGAFFGWNLPGLIMPAAIIGFVLAFITIFRSPAKAKVTAIPYAFVEGLMLGGITGFAESMYPGIAINAVGLTFAIVAAMLFFYKSGIIKPTENFKLMIWSGIVGVFSLYLINFIMMFFGNSIGFIHSNGTFGILFSLFVVGLASMTLVLDFDFIEEAADKGLPKYMEWYSAFSLMVTLIWLYMEVLRLLMKLQSRR